MQVTQTNAEGLKREFKVTVPAGQLQESVDARLQELRNTVNLPGFRPGHVPVALLKKRYGGAALGEVLEILVADGTQQIMTDHGLRPAMQPKIDIVSFSEGADLEFTVAFETLPDVPDTDFGSIELERQKIEVGDADIDRALEQLAKRQNRTEPVTEDRGAENGDVAVIDFVGKKDDVPFQGGSASDYPLTLGSGAFIPGFEEQLVGRKAGEKVDVRVTFPEDYGNKDLAGQAVSFDVTVKELRRSVPALIDDELAKTFGMEELSALRQAMKDEMERDFAGMARADVKRKLLDALADKVDFPLPQSLVESEFDGIWKQLEQEKAAGRLDAEDAAKSEDELKAEYRRLAERRVRLGLLLADVGQKNNIQVSQEDLNAAVINQARRYPGQEAQVFRFYQSNQEAMNQLRGEIYEDKVVDFVLELAKITDKPISAEDFVKAAGGDAGEQAEGAEDQPAEKPKKKASKKKAAEAAED